jgi:pimeloyl-ACP methyl ester carboxylesterase
MAAGLPPLVLLHGIGSCAASWRAQLARLSAERRVLAWDAPGYGDSAPLPLAEPLAADYADVAAAWLAAAGVAAAARPVLLGHSLGALMAAALAVLLERNGTGAGALVLVSPAQGYATASAEVRAAKLKERVDALRTLGAERMAAERAARLCAPGAAAAAVAEVRANMARVREPGYVQAAWMLSNDAIAPYLARVSAPVAVLCGELDGVTPPQPARALAERIGAPFTRLRGVGHACYIEDSTGFDRALLEAIGESEAGCSSTSPSPTTEARHG